MGPTHPRTHPPTSGGEGGVCKEEESGGEEPAALQRPKKQCVGKRTDLPPVQVKFTSQAHTQDEEGQGRSTGSPNLTKLRG